MDDRGINDAGEHPEQHLDEQEFPDKSHDDTSMPAEQKESTTPVVTQPIVQERMIPVAETQPAYVGAAEVPAAKQQANPITLVLQWLAYAFWGWFALALSWLVFVTFAYFTDQSIIGDDLSTVVAYPIAAVVVLLLMSVVTDMFYMRREPAHKTGVATAIMVVHTVIFALFGVGLIVSSVFIVLQMMLNTSADKTLYAFLYTALVGIVVYVILVLRTTMVAKVKRLALITMASLSAIALLFVVLCIAGPVVQSLATKQDRQVESALSVVQSAVVSYTEKNNKLPTTVSMLNFDDGLGAISNKDVQSLLKKGVIEYTPNMKAPYQSDDSSSQDTYMRSFSTSYYFELCATFTHDKNPNKSSRYPASDNSPYSGASNSSSYDYLDTYSHKAGRQCYTLRATGDNYSSTYPTPMPIRN